MIYGVLGFSLSGAMWLSWRLRAVEVDTQTFFGSLVMIWTACMMKGLCEIPMTADHMVAATVFSGMSMVWLYLLTPKQVAALGANVYLLCAMEAMVVHALVEMGKVGEQAYFFAVAPMFVVFGYTITMILYIFFLWMYAGLLGGGPK